MQEETFFPDVLHQILIIFSVKVLTGSDAGHISSREKLVTLNMTQCTAAGV